MSLYVTILDPRMRELVLPIARLKRLSTGHLWAEGPVWLVAGEFLLWSNIPRNRTYQWVPDPGVRIFSQDSRNANGQTMDHEGRRIVCERLTRSVVRLITPAPRGPGRQLPGPPTERAVRCRGGGGRGHLVHRSDLRHPQRLRGRRADPEQPGCHVYRIDPVTGAVEARISSMQKSNGLAFWPEGDRIYVADRSASHDDCGHRHAMGFAIAPWGHFERAETVVAEVSEGVPDGLRVDEVGNHWVSSAVGVEVFAPDGTGFGVLNLPEPIANLCFGGPKGNRLSVTAASSIYAVQPVYGAGRVERT